MEQIVRHPDFHPYYMTPNKAFDLYAPVLGLTGWGIYQTLLRYSNTSTKECFPSYSRICAQWGMSRKTVAKYLKLLVAIGLIRYKRQIDEKTGGTQNNLYTILPVPDYDEDRVTRALASVEERDHKAADLSFPGKPSLASPETYPSSPEEPPPGPAGNSNNTKYNKTNITIKTNNTPVSPENSPDPDETPDTDAFVSSDEETSANFFIQEYSIDDKSLLQTDIQEDPSAKEEPVEAVRTLKDYTKEEIETYKDACIKAVAQGKPQPDGRRKRGYKYALDFCLWWTFYPKVRGTKENAAKAWEKLRKANRLLPVMSMIGVVGYEQQKNPQWREEDGKYIPMASTWLNSYRHETAYEMMMEEWEK